MNTSRSFSNRSIVRYRVGAVLTAAIATFVASQQAFADQTKADNTSNLDLGASWGGTAPTSTDLAIWAGTYNTTNSLSDTFTASTPVSWLGIQIGNITGTAAGTVSIGGTGTVATGSQVTIGTGGVDLSAANENLVLNAATIALTGATETWNVAAGRNFRLNATSASAKLTGTASTVITVTGGGVVDLNEGGSAGFSDAAGFSGFNGKWVVGANTTLRGIRNGATAFGSNTAADAITLSGGTLAVGGISGTQGNWSWTTNMTLTAGTSSTLDNQIYTGTGRFLKLNGVITGSGNLTIANTNTTSGGLMDANNGFILTGTNTLSGTLTINSGAFLRVGGSKDTTSANGAGAGAAGTLGSATVVNNGWLTFSRSDSQAFSNSISGSGVVLIGGTTSTSITGANTQMVTLSGTNTYTGGTQVNTGYVTFANSSAVPATGGVTIGKDGSLVATGALTSVTMWLGAGTINTSSTGAIAIPGNSAEDINFATFGYNSLGISSTGTATYSGTITPGTGGYIFGGSTAAAALTVTSPLTGASGLTKNGASTLVVQDSSSVNTYSGGTTITNGILRVAGSNTALGTGPINFTTNSSTLATQTGGGPITLSNSVSIASGITATIDSGYATMTLAGNITGAGNIATTSIGTTVLSGSNSYTGTTTVGASSTLQIGSATALGGSGAATVTSGGTLDLNGQAVGAKALTINGAGVSSVGALTNSSATAASYGGTVALGAASTIGGSGNLTLSGVVSGAFALTKSGAGTLVFGNTNTYSGVTTISAGTLQVGNGGAAGTLGSGAVTNNSALVFNRTDAALSVANVISGTGSVSQNGTGTVTMSGASTYTGATNVNAGTLLVSGSLTGTTSVNVAAGAVLGGTGTIALGGASASNVVSVAAGGVIAPGTASTPGMLSVNTTANSVAVGIGSLSLASGASFQFKLNVSQNDKVNLITGTTGDQIDFTGNAINFSDLSSGTLPSGTYTLFTADSSTAFSGLSFAGDGQTIIGGLSIGTGLAAYTGSSLMVSGNNIVLSVVPEPSAGAALLAGLGMLLGLRRRKQSAAI